MIVGGTSLRKRRFLGGKGPYPAPLPKTTSRSGQTTPATITTPREKSPDAKKEKSEFDEALKWAGKQYIGAGNYWLLNKWGRWETYTYRDVAEDWAMNKALRLTNKLGQRAINQLTTSPSPYQPWATGAAVGASGGRWLALGGLSWMVGGGIILNSFQASGWNPNTPNEFDSF